jgi:hypothetical protein
MITLSVKAGSPTAAQVGVARTWPGLEHRLRTGAIGSGCT